MMRSNIQNPITKPILLFLLFISLIILIQRSSFFSSSSFHQSLITKSSSCQTQHQQQSLTQSTCTKTPPSLAQALIHYATSNTTPQQTINEISISSKVLEKLSPCNFLVFGLGHDSLMWTSLNHGGRTVFLEENKDWINQIKKKLPTLESYHVEYDTKRHQANELMKIGMGKDCQVVGDPRFSKCGLALKGLPSEVYEVEWDLIMVDAPTGYFEDAPGRMGALYTAGLMARFRESGETHVFVHDVDRDVEDRFSKAFLCQGYLREQEGRLRHFLVPSHRARTRLSFCPESE